MREVKVLVAQLDDRVEIDNPDRFPQRKDEFHPLRLQLLAAQLGCRTDAVRLCYTNGKPAVAGRDNFHFCTSYSNHVMALACSDQPVGVDIEHQSANPGNWQVVDELFHHEERRGITAASGQQQVAMFYHIWTQKEAFAKAIGEGFGIEFAEFAVNSSGGVVKCDGKLNSDEPWYTQSQDLEDQLILAVASGDPDIELAIEIVAPS